MARSWRQIVHEVDAAPSLHQALAVLVQGVKNALPVNACAVYLTSSEDDALALSASDGLDETAAAQVRDDYARVISLVAKQRELVVLPNVLTHVHYRGSRKAEEERHRQEEEAKRLKKREMKRNRGK